MTLRYKKRVKVAPGLYLNISKNGISTSLGVRGASVTFGKNGTYINTGIPGTGFYSRQKLGGKLVPYTGNASSDSTTKIHSKGTYTFVAILCGFTAALCCTAAPVGLIGTFLFGAGMWSNLSKRKKYYGKKSTESNNIPSLINDANAALAKSTDDRHKKVLQNFINTVETIDSIEDEEYILQSLNKNPAKNIELISTHSAKLTSLRSRLESTILDVDKTVPADVLTLYENVCQSFEQLLTAQKIWIQIPNYLNSRPKSSTTAYVNLKETNFGVGVFDYLKSSFDIPVIPAGNRFLYLYPEYAILSSSPSRFEIIDYTDLSIIYTTIRFNEPGKYPTDAEHIGDTWEYVNKNGEPDRRYSKNSRIAVVKYGGITVKIYGKVSVTFQVSNARIAEDFCSSFNKFAGVFKSNETENSESIPEPYPLTVNTDGISGFSLSEVIQTVERLYQCLIYMSDNRQVIDALNNHKQLDMALEVREIGNDRMDKRIAIVAATDLIKCFDRLGHRPDMTTDEGRAIGIALLRIIFPDNEVWRNQSLMYSAKGKSLLAQCYNMIKNNIHIEFDPDKFLLIELLRHEGVNEEIINKWAVLLYRYALLIAKADGVLSDTEQLWLTNILSFTKNGEVNTGKTTVNTVEELSSGSDLEHPGNEQKKVKQQTVTNPMKELESLIGLAGVKTEITNIYNLVKVQKVRKAKGLNAPDISYHCVFTGNPGTGKTTVARLVAKIYKQLGILSKGHLIETDRSGLVAEYVGQTAVKTNKIIDSALDGVLFIDEAYSLIQNGGGNDYGLEAIATLLKRMEDNRDRLVVILAGYSDEMKQFIDSNPGLQSRFNRYIHFEDYSTEELTAIYESNLSKFDYEMTPEAADTIKAVMENAVANKDKNFGNARFVRNLFEKTLERQAKRLAASSLSSITEDVLVKITKEDIAGQ